MMETIGFPMFSYILMALCIVYLLVVCIRFMREALIDKSYYVGFRDGWKAANEFDNSSGDVVDINSTKGNLILVKSTFVRVKPSKPPRQPDSRIVGGYQPVSAKTPTSQEVSISVQPPRKP